MKLRILGFGIAAAACTFLLLLSSSPAPGQQKTAYTVKRGWYNQPDLQGIWMANGKPNENIEKGGFIKDPPNGKIPYLPAALAQRDQNAKNAKNADLVNKCYMPGIPRLMYVGYPFQIFQSEKYVAIASEYAHVYRMIYLDGSPHIDGLDFWDGDARGHWEGDSLVAEVTNFNDRTWFDKAGNYHSDQLRVNEKFTRTAPHTLVYEAIIHDPKTFSKDWKIVVPMTEKTGPTTRLMEYECQDLAFGGH